MKKPLINILCSFLTLSLCGATLTRPKEFRKMVRSGSEFVPNESKIMSTSGEPTCEELRAMWRFSRRQSRAAEITNEIPTYRDPFAYNVWEQYPKVRSVLGTLRTPVRPWSRPIYGRIVQHAPSSHPRVVPPENRAYDEVLRYVDNGKPEEEPRRRPSTPTYRVSGGQAPPNRLSRTGSFQHLKELIWAERAKELHQQRMLEEAAAKSAAEKNIQQFSDNSKGQNSHYRYNMDQEAKAARLRLLNGEPELEAAYAPELYRKSYRPRSVSVPNFLLPINLIFKHGTNCPGKGQRRLTQTHQARAYGDAASFIHPGQRSEELQEATD
ncbi:hypothetical protein RUM44_006441 [Polyplax serrata]|uniref:Uncharacterized protein n=1 Tax=Polyplax serrata TaxID=468196 RepID=A0ABR1AI40_POLSC